MAELVETAGGLPAREPALVIAIVGAESTGKTRLAAALAERLGELTGLRSTWVPEHLREWCEVAGRTPRPEEQAAIAREQRERIEAAAAAHAVVVCDTTPLMTAVYSRLLFADDSLLPDALAWQRERCTLTLLTALDLPWVPDGHQRDGPHVQPVVDAALRSLLAAHGVGWSLVAGHAAARVEAAVDAAAPLLRGRAGGVGGLFTRLQDRDAESAWRPWTCLRCDDPDCARAEHRLARLTF